MPRKHTRVSILLFLPDPEMSTGEHSEMHDGGNARATDCFEKVANHSLRVSRLAIGFLL
jgi:hypothetical protein